MARLIDAYATEAGMTTETHFSVGEIVHHTKFGYHGVIIAVDPVFTGTDEWYANVAQSRPPKGRPWYHVLVDGESHGTYVAERHLETDTSGQQIDHPALGRHFDRFLNGRYVRHGDTPAH